MSSEIEEIDEYSNQIKVWSLGKLVDNLIQLRLEDAQKDDEDESPTEKSKRTLQIKALKDEISSRETGQKESNSANSQGVSSLGNLI